MKILIQTAPEKTFALHLPTSWLIGRLGVWLMEKVCKEPRGKGLTHAQRRVLRHALRPYAHTDFVLCEINDTDGSHVRILL